MGRQTRAGGTSRGVTMHGLGPWVAATKLVRCELRRRVPTQCRPLYVLLALTLYPTEPRIRPMTKDDGGTDMNWTRIGVPALALVIGAGGAAAGFVLAGYHGPSMSSGSNSQGSGMMGDGATGAGGGMMGGSSDIARGASGGLVPATRMESLATQAAHSVQRNGQTLFYRSEHVTLVALGAPGNRPGMYWQLDGVDGATVSVPAAATITVNFADGDPGHPHGFELTTAAPPYPRMAMMTGHVATTGAFIMPVPAPEGSLWYAATISFTAPSPGTYYIICPVPGHAQQGMWAKFIVR